MSLLPALALGTHLSSRLQHSVFKHTLSYFFGLLASISIVFYCVTSHTAIIFSKLV